MKKLFIFLSIVLGIYIYSTAQERHIGFQVDMSENQNYDSAIYHAKAACAEYIHFSLDWNILDTNLAMYDSSGVELIKLINMYYPTQNIALELNIPVINTVKREVPIDLESIPFDSALMITRFKMFLDTLFFYMPDVELIALNIGNESDVYWGTDTAAVFEFKIFLDSVQPYAKNLYQNIHGDELKCGSTLCYDALVDNSMKNIYQQFNANNDVISLTYYPLGINFQVLSPNSVPFHFSELINLYPDTSKPILFAECGFPSSSGCSSSEELQRQFIWNVFQAWDTYQENIRWISFFSLTDWSSETVDTLVIYYGLQGHAGFWSFLASLGLRNYPGNGSSKIAYEELRCQASFRNFCAADCILSIHEENSKPIKIFPNPVNSILKVESSFTNFRYSIIDCKGVIYLSGENSNEINIKNLEAGIYIIRIITEENKLHQQEFIKVTSNN